MRSAARFRTRAESRDAALSGQAIHRLPTGFARDFWPQCAELWPLQCRGIRKPGMADEAISTACAVCACCAGLGAFCPTANRSRPAFSPKICGRWPSHSELTGEPSTMASAASNLRQDRTPYRPAADILLRSAPAPGHTGGSGCKNRYALGEVKKCASERLFPARPPARLRPRYRSLALAVAADIATTLLAHPGSNSIRGRLLRRHSARSDRALIYRQASPGRSARHWFLPGGPPARQRPTSETSLPA